jgi:hypothetical protein
VENRADDREFKEYLLNISNTLEDFLSELKELNRPYVLVDILPSKVNPNLLEVVMNNMGKSPAYNITCTFDPSLPYTDETTLTDLTLFKSQFVLSSNQELRFFYGDLFSILAKGPAFGPKKTEAVVRYEDSKKKVFQENYSIDLERFKGLLGFEQRSINDLFKELGNIRKELERIQGRGLLIKTTADVEKEKSEAEKIRNQLRETHGLKDRTENP